MDCRTLEYVVCVADSGNFRAAADRCHVTPSTLSIQVRKLEDALGVKIFDRMQRPILPTAQGEVLLPYFRRICENVAEVRRLSRQRRTGNGVDPPCV